VARCVLREGGHDTGVRIHLALQLDPYCSDHEQAINDRSEHSSASSPAFLLTTLGRGIKASYHLCILT
jgi:hypothetical protein